MKSGWAACSSLGVRPASWASARTDCRDPMSWSSVAIASRRRMSANSALVRRLAPSKTTIDALTKIPWFGGHSKYLFSRTTPEFLPTGLSRTTPTQTPGENMVSPTKRTVPGTLSALVMRTRAPSGGGGTLASYDDLRFSLRPETVIPARVGRVTVFHTRGARALAERGGHAHAQLSA